MKGTLRVKMPDGSTWAVPIEVIARDRAKHYAHEFDGDIEKALQEDTYPLFESDDYEIEDWAANNMNWTDVRPFAQLISGAAEVDYQEGWVNGDHLIVRD